MRWRFPDPTEESERRVTLARVDAFWSAFAGQAAAIERHCRREEPWDLPGWMHERLGAIHPELRWEIGPAGEGHWLALTHDGPRRLRPLVSQVLARAPELAGWQWHAFRPALGEREAALLTEARLGQPLDGWSCQVAPVAHNCVGLRFGVPGCQGPRDRGAHRAARLVAEALLGQELLERWVGTLRVEPSLPDGAPLGELLDRAETTRRRQVETLPPRPARALADGGDWTLYKLNPRRRPDYRHQDDLYVAKALLPAVWRCAHDGVAFYSGRFSRAGETFCYLKYDDEQGFAEGGFEDKGQAEQALDEALDEAQLGCVIGGGSGLRYGYIDLALLDVERAFGVIERVLREGRAPQRTWLLFFDDELADEWIGLWPHTPAPP